MDHFSLCFNAIMPLLLLMLLGYGMRRIDFLPKAGFDAMDRLCFQVLIPVMLFRNVYAADFSTEFHLDAVVFMELALVLIFLATFFLVPRLMPDAADAAATIHGICHGNLAVLGMPLIQNLFGPTQVAVYSIMMACTSPLVNPLMVFEHVYFQGERVRASRLVKQIFTSPYLIGTLAGLACNAAELRMPAFWDTTLSSLASIASPLCLIALGGSFTFGGIHRYAVPVVHSVLAKCVWIPAVVLAVAVALGFRGIVLASLLVIFCCPSAAATYSYCTGYCGNPVLASQIVVYSTACSIVTMFLWLFAFLQLGLF